MSRQKLELCWPVDALPVIHRAGRYPLDDQHFARTYRAPTHALHVYDYHARMKRGGGRVEVIRPGDVTVSPAGRRTSYHLPEAGRHLCVHFWPVRQRRTQNAAVARLALYQRLGPRREYVVQRLMAVIRMHANQDPVAQAAASAAFLELLLWLAQQQPTSTPGTRQADRAVEAAADLIEERLDQPVRVPALARHVGLSQNYLARRFRARTGMTINAYLLARRVDLARHLLTTTDQPIKRIAAQVGMPDAQHFNKQFRRLTGLSPSAARAIGAPDRAS